MKTIHLSLKGRGLRFAAYGLLGLTLVAGVGLGGSVDVSANHPVLVEGNCDSPVPGTTLVAPGTCGDFDGDGRIGTAEDTDGADRIFGTLNAALGPGTGAAAGTGANHNGKLIIVSSGRFAEQLYIGQNIGGPAAGGVADPGNVTIEAAPGVDADIDAVLQGDPAGGNNTRQGGAGIQIVYTVTGASRVVNLRNLEIRNFVEGIVSNLNSRVHIDNCRLEGNLNAGIVVADNSRVVITRTQIDNTGFRVGSVGNPPNLGDGVLVRDLGQARISNTVISHSAGAGIRNLTGGAGPAGASNVVLYKVETYFNNPNTFGAVTLAPDPNFSH